MYSTKAESSSLPIVGPYPIPVYARPDAAKVGRAL